MKEAANEAISSDQEIELRPCLGPHLLRIGSVDARIIDNTVIRVCVNLVARHGHSMAYLS